MSDSPPPNSFWSGTAALGEEALRSGRYTEAEELLLNACEGDEVGTVGLRLARCLRELGGIFRKQGLHNRAERLLVKALSLAETTIPPPPGQLRSGTMSEDDELAREEQLLRHLELTDFIDDLAALYLEQGRLAAAERLFKRSLAIDKSSVGLIQGGEGDVALLNVASDLYHLATVYFYQERYDRAEDLLKRVLEIDSQELELVVNSASTAGLAPAICTIARDQRALARVYQAQGRIEEAEPLFRRAMAIHEEHLDDGDPDLLASIEAYADYLRVAGRTGEARKLDSRARRLRAKQDEGS